MKAASHQGGVPGGVRTDGRREILGLWIEQTEGAKFWLKVFTELRARGCDDILIAVTDGLKGMPDALEAAYPRTTPQTCIVHLIRQSLEFASYRDREPLAKALKTIYGATTDAAALPPWTPSNRVRWGSASRR
jgi:transposase-like protein